MKEIKFEVMPYSWFKRRTPTFVPPNVTYVGVLGFEKEHNLECGMLVKWDDGIEEELKAIVSENRTYRIGGAVDHHGWNVSGTAENGRTVSVRLIED